MDTDRAGSILVIEDDAAVRRLLVDTLEDEGYQVLSAATAGGAWEILHRQQLDLVLLDLMLPDTDANEMMRRLRAEPMLAEVPLLMLVTRTAMEDQITGLSAGADDYITKPFHPRELVARVATHLRRSERARNLNPLTRLPGNRTIEHAIEIHVARHQPIAVSFIDIDNFKGFNSTHGFAAGDTVLQTLADLLRQAVLGGKDHVAALGHISGDDFLAVVYLPRAKAVCEAILEDFTAARADFYSTADLVQGYTVSRDRRGAEQRVPLMSLSVAVVPVHGDEPVERASLAAIYQSAAEIKTFLKSQEGGNFLIDRRRLDQRD